MKFLSIYFLLYVYFTACEAQVQKQNNNFERGKILIWMSIGSKSHWNAWKPMVYELAKRGHEITAFLPFEDNFLSNMDNVKLGNLLENVQFALHILHEGLILFYFTKIVSFGFTLDVFNSTEIFTGEYDPNNSTQFQLKLMEVSREIPKRPEVQKLMKEQPFFDVAILSPFGHELGYYICKKFLHNPPIISFFAGAKWPHVDKAIGNPFNPTYVPLDFIDAKYKQD